MKAGAQNRGSGVSRASREKKKKLAGRSGARGCGAAEGTRKEEDLEEKFPAPPLGDSNYFLNRDCEM